MAANKTTLLVVGLGALWFLSQKKDDDDGGGGKTPVVLGTYQPPVYQEEAAAEDSGPSYSATGAPAPVVGCDPPRMFRVGDTPDDGCLFFPHVPFAPPPWGIPTPGWPINVGWSVPDLGAPDPTGTLEIVGEGEVYGGASGNVSGLNIA